MKLKSLIFAIISASSAFAAEPPPLVLNAVLSAGKEKHFGLATASGAHSSWMTLGQKFEGFTLKEFDDKAQTLVLEKDGKTDRISLASGSITTANTKATVADAQEVVGKMHFEEMIGKMVNQQKDMSVSMAQQMVGKMAGSKMSQEDQDALTAFQAKVVDAMWSAMKPEDLKNDVTKIYSDLFTKEELHGMSDFYSTPSGEALITKQPDLQKKMMEVMMPKMMSAMPQIQQMGKEFAAAQAARKAAAAPASSSPGTAPAPSPAK